MAVSFFLSKASPKKTQPKNHSQTFPKKTMPFTRTTPKSSARKRQDRHRRQDDAASDENDDDYNVVESPQNDAASYADSYSESQTTTSLNLPYVHIAPFPTFRGGSSESPDAHLRRFAKVCRANNAASAEAMARIFPVTLEGEASLWYDLNIEPYESRLTWDDIRSSFSDAFASAETTPPEAELAAFRQGEEESVQSYFLRLQLIMKKLVKPGEAYGLVIGDEKLRDIFVGGLRGEVREGVEGMKPGSLSEALSLALREREIGRSVSMAGGAGESQCQCWKRNGIQRDFSNVNASFKRL